MSGSVIAGDFESAFVMGHAEIVFRSLVRNYSVVKISKENGDLKSHVAGIGTVYVKL